MRASVLTLVVGLAFSVGLLLAQEQMPRGELGISTLEELNRLYAEKSAAYERQLEQYGEDHLSVKFLKLELSNISNMREQKLKQLPSWARQNVSAMSDDQLRYMVGVLVERVATLENEVKLLKQPVARIELLSTNAGD